MMEYSKRYTRISRLPKILALLLIIILIYTVMHYIGYFRTICEDQTCFYEKARECNQAEVKVIKDHNVYTYTSYIEPMNRCNLKITLARVQEGSPPEYKELLEGKSMKCTLTKEQMSKLNIDNPNNIIKECHGELKEGLYELVIQRMTELVIANLGEITEETKEILNTV